MAERHLSYYNLRDAFSSYGCPFCIIVEKGLIKYFDDLLYEGVNIAETAKDLSKSKGFCKLHSKLLFEFSDALGTAILYQRVLDEMNNYLKQSSLKKYIDEVKNFKENQNKFCPACVKEKEIFERYADIFINFTDDFLSKYGRKDAFPICFEHFNVLIDKLIKIKSPQIKEFKDLHEKNIKSFMEKLENLINSYNYHHKEKKISELEKRAWIDAVEIISGKNYSKKRSSRY